MLQSHHQFSQQLDKNDCIFVFKWSPVTCPPHPPYFIHSPSPWCMLSHQLKHPPTALDETSTGLEMVIISCYQQLFHIVFDKENNMHWQIGVWPDPRRDRLKCMMDKGKRQTAMGAIIYRNLPLPSAQLTKLTDLHSSTAWYSRLTVDYCYGCLAPLDL